MEIKTSDSSAEDNRMANRAMGIMMLMWAVPIAFISIGLWLKPDVRHKCYQVDAAGNVVGEAPCPPEGGYGSAGASSLQAGQAQRGGFGGSAAGYSGGA